MLLETYSSQNSEQLREVLPNFLKIGNVFAIYMQFIKKNSLDAGIQDSSTSISIMYKIEEMSHEEEEGNGDESDKHI